MPAFLFVRRSRHQLQATPTGGASCNRRRLSTARLLRFPLVPARAVVLHRKGPRAPGAGWCSTGKGSTTGAGWCSIARTRVRWFSFHPRSQRHVVDLSAYRHEYSRLESWSRSHVEEDARMALGWSPCQLHPLFPLPVFLARVPSRTTGPFSHNGRCALSHRRRSRTSDCRLPECASICASSDLAPPTAASLPRGSSDRRALWRAMCAEIRAYSGRLERHRASCPQHGEGIAAEGETDRTPLPRASCLLDLFSACIKQQFEARRLFFHRWRENLH